jgi:hypothetical protein
MAAKHLKPYFKPRPFGPRHNDQNTGGSRERMLDMKRERYFRFDLDDILTEYKITENKGSVAATILNKASRSSVEAAFEYIDRIKASGTINDAAAERLKILLQRYSKWR